jgi:hypothetical protein
VLTPRRGIRSPMCGVLSRMGSASLRTDRTPPSTMTDVTRCPSRPTAPSSASRIELLWRLHVPLSGSAGRRAGSLT